MWKRWMRAQTGTHRWRLRVLWVQILCAAPASRDAQVCEYETVLPNCENRKYKPAEFTGDEFSYECGVLKPKKIKKYGNACQDI
jgi:hypothetical protein